MTANAPLPATTHEHIGPGVRGLPPEASAPAQPPNPSCVLPTLTTSERESPSIELLPPSPTRSLSSLGSSEDEVRRPPSRLEEMARMCVGLASVRSREHSDDGEPPETPVNRLSRWWPRGKSPKLPKIVMSVGQHERQPFAADVVIKGWQVVGGKSWTGGGKVGAYVVYDIEISLRNGTPVSVLRRYTEFVRLREDLRTAFPHLRNTIPQLPGKNHMSKFSPEFLEDRRPRLQRFLRTVMLHPEMGVGGEESVLGRWVLNKA